MIWSIEISNEAKRSLLEIERYIADVLLEPATAEKQLDRIRDAIWKLDQLPFRHRLYEHEPWHSLGFRVFPVDNYLIFYLPDEAAVTVTISHIIHRHIKSLPHFINDAPADLAFFFQRSCVWDVKD